MVILAGDYLIATASHTVKNAFIKRRKRGRHLAAGASASGRDLPAVTEAEWASRCHCSAQGLNSQGANYAKSIKIVNFIQIRQ